MTIERQSSERASEAPERELLDGRYLVLGTLGRGGMAVAYDVIDNASGRRCALKRLLLPERVDRRAAAVTLFEREFLTLSELQHPNVVSVFDYGLDDGLPYYTMELLTGADLLARVPLPWRAACSVARDLCSVLALIHSRRLIYRDLNPRNVRSAEGGLTKLIDFGAMSPMGPNRQLVGTPAFCAPEAVHFQPLDARTDLYALGAMLYLLLTARVPFHAKTFAQLRNQWQTAPPPPSHIDREIPAALDRLVMDLLQLDPALRPASAADVIDRLCAVAGLASDERLTIPQAYLSTPTLTARAALLDAVRERASGALSGRGASVVLSGRAGAGRSRLIGACELEAKLLGMTVLRADATDAASGPYGVARALALQLLEAAGDAAMPLLERHAPVLVHVVPELRERLEGLVALPIDVQALDQRVQPALRQWLIEVSRKRPLLIAVDDVERIDRASSAFVALLAQEASSASVLLIASTESSADAPVHASAALELLLRESTVLAVEPLDARATKELLGSVFGEVPNLQLLAHRLHEITSGNPRDLMQMAQHLVDQGVLRYRNGAWTVPGDLDVLGLPSGMAQALRERVQMLGEDARSLARTIAHSPDQRFAFEECRVLAEHDDRGDVMRWLDELLAAGVLRLEAGLFALAQRGWVTPLLESQSPAGAQASHARLSELFALRKDEFRVAQHLLRAGRTERGLTALVEHASRSRKHTDEDLEAFLVLLRTLPGDWRATYEQALRLCAELGRPRAQVHALRARLCGLVAANSINGNAHFEALIADLSRSCGLDVYAALDPALPPLARLQSAFGDAQRRYEQTPPEERIEDPGTAVRELARVLVQVSGMIALGLDHDLARRMPSLEPLFPLSPALRVVDELVRGVAARVAGRAEQTIAIYDGLIERLAQPDRGGLDPAHYNYTVMGVQCGAGMLEATIGRGSCLARAALVEPHPQHQVNALFMRMLFHLWQGDLATAQRFKREAELARIQNTQPRPLEGSHLLGELTGYAMSSDLTGVKHVAEAVARQVQAFSGWLPVLHYARGERDRLRGDNAAALLELETAVAMMEPGCHQAWVWAAAAHVRVLCELGRNEQARALGAQYLAHAVERGLGYTANYVRMPLGLALANLGEHAGAAELAQTCIDEFLALGATGVNLCLAYEARARVAIRAGDLQSLELCLEALAQAQAATNLSVFGTTLDRVEQEARRAGLSAPPAEAAVDARDGDDAAALSALVTASMSACDTSASRAQAALELLMRRTGSCGGLLYTVERDGVALLAESGELGPSQAVAEFVSEQLAAELRSEHTTTFDDPSSAAVQQRSSGGVSQLRPILLSHDEGGSRHIAAVVVLLRAGHGDVPDVLVSALSRALVSC